MSSLWFPADRTTRRLFSAALAALLAFTALALIPGNTPPASAAQDGSYSFTFIHIDGSKTTISDSFSGSWNVSIPNAGGSSVTEPAGMTVHMSCSDAFVDGWGSEGGPVEGVDTEWRVFSYFIEKAQGDACGTPPTTTTTTVPPTTTTTTVPPTTTTTTVPPTTTTTTVPPTRGIVIEKSTNGVDADSAPGPSITVGDTVTWTYVVANTGQVDLTGVVVTDDVLGDVCTVGDLAIGESKTCELTGTAAVGQYANVGTVEDNNGEEPSVTDSDPSHYFGQDILASATIGDTVWSDENANGIQDNSEKGIAGATVRLTLPNSTTIDTITNANGLYLFSGLDAGGYKSELILSSIAKPSEGDLKLTTAGSFTIQLLDGQSYLDADFGVVATLPKTGLPTDTLALIATMLLLAGTLALLATRRRKPTA
jgi:LPXTG-motif cell wall-anchored protein